MSDVAARCADALERAARGAEGARARGGGRTRAGGATRRRDATRRDDDATTTRDATRSVTDDGSMTRDGDAKLKTGDARRAMEACRSLCARGRGLEARHFGFGVLRDVARTRWRGLTAEERMEMASLAHGMLLEVSAGDAAEAYAVKSKAATLVAETVRQEGASLWTRLVPDLVSMTTGDEAQRAEMGVNVIRYVAEDVAVYNEDMIGGKMRELLGGLSSTVGTILPAIYALMEKHYTKATAATDREVAKRHAAAVNAALGAAAVYSEWAPLAPIMRSGLIEACGMLLVRLVFFARASFFSSSNTRTRTTPMMIIQ